MPCALVVSISELPEKFVFGPMSQSPCFGPVGGCEKAEYVQPNPEAKKEEMRTEP